MSILAMRLVLGLLFLVLGVVILARQWLTPGLFAGYDPLRLNLGGTLALVFGGLNLARWYAAWSFWQTTQTAVRYPLQPDPSAAPQVEPIAEFDFFKRQENNGSEKQAGEPNPDSPPSGGKG